MSPQNEKAVVASEGHGRSSESSPRVQNTSSAHLVFLVPHEPHHLMPRKFINSVFPIPPSLTRGINSSILLALVGAALMKMSVS